MTRKHFTWTVLILVVSASAAGAAGIGGECKTGLNVDPSYLCPVGTSSCLKAIGKMYCSNPGMVCGWPNTGGYTLGVKKDYGGKKYECTVTGFKLTAGQRCSSGSTCATGLCLKAIGNSYCSNVGMVCGWPDASGYPLGTKKQWDGKDYICTPTGFVLAPRLRELNSAERSLAARVFGRTINFSQVRVSDTIGAGNRAWTTNTPPLYTMNVGEAFANLTSYPRLLIHELTHVWQGQHGVPFMSNSAYHQALAMIASGGSAGGAYTYVKGQPWSKYNVEQQASIVEDWYSEGMSTNSKLYPYIVSNVQKGDPNATTRF